MFLYIPQVPAWDFQLQEPTYKERGEVSINPLQEDKGGEKGFSRPWE